VGIGGPGNAGFLVEQMGERYGKRLVIAIEQIILIRNVLAVAALHAAFKGCAQLGNLIGLQHHARRLAVLGQGRHFGIGKHGQPKVFPDHGQNILKRGLRMGLAEGVELLIKGNIGNFLVFQAFLIRIVFCARKSQRHAAGFVVTGHNNQRFIGVALHKMHCLGHGGVKGKHIGDGAYGIVGVTGPVNLAAFHHHEEALGVIQQLKALARHFCQRHIAVCGIHGIGHGLLILQVRVYKHHAAAAGLEGAEGLRVVHIVKPGRAHGVQHVYFRAFSLGFFAGRIKKTAARKIIHAASGQFQPYFIIIFAARLMRIKGRRGCVIQGNRGDDAHLHAVIACHFRNGNNGGVFAVHAQPPVDGFYAAGHGRARSGRISDERIKGIGGGGPLHRQAAHVQFDDAGPHVAFLRGQVCFGRIALRHAHAIADEQNDVFGVARSGLRMGKPHGAKQQHDAKGANRPNRLPA